MSGVTITAKPTTVTNITPTQAVITFSNTPYPPNQTKVSPAIPLSIPQTFRSSTGNRAASGRAVAVMAAAPYTKPQMTT
ncbi:hypothetical protein D3C86_1298920 [compost metagenome]